MDDESSIHNHFKCMLLDASAEPRDLPLSFLKAITNDFSDDQKIGKGGFAVVYKGQLQNGTIVAVKKLENVMEEDNFIKEVDCLMRVRHKNIVQFLGYCADTQGKLLKYEGRNVMADVPQRLLCFEFLPNKSLDKYITDPSQGLDWRTRYRIILGICKGLDYLHQKRILHLDLKPANVLLTNDMVPKLADFGLSRCFHENKSQTIASKASGTLGYMAPELINNGIITFKSDIYSFGIVILEMLTEHKGCHSVIEVVLESWSHMFDASQEEIGMEKVIRVCAEIGIECIDPNPEKRPTTKRIIEVLHEIGRAQGIIDTDFCTSSATHKCSIWPPGIDKLLDVHPLELRFPFEPNKSIKCPVSLANKTNYYVGIWITPTWTDTSFDLCFLDSWDHNSEDDNEEEDDGEEEEEEDGEEDEKLDEEGNSEEVGESPKDPCSYFFKILQPHSTLIVAMAMKKQHESPTLPQDMGKFEVAKIIMWSEQDLKDLETSIGNKLNIHNDLVKKVEELGGEVHSATLKAVICDPASCHATVSKKIVSTVEFPAYIDVNPINSWILAVHDQGYVCIWNYQTQERVMELQVIKKDTCSISAAKFISRKQWFVAGDDRGYIHVYDYTTKDMVIKFKAHHRGKAVSSLAVHATFPFLLSSSDEENNSSVKLWNWEEGWACTRTFDGHNTGVLGHILNPRDINSFASISNDDTVKVWNIHSSNPEITLTLVDALGGIDYLFTDSHQPLQLISCSSDASIWDLQRRKLVHSLAMHGSSMDHIACHPMLPILVTTWEGTLFLWDANTYRLEKMVHLTRDPIQDLVFLDTKDIPRIVIGCEDGIAILEINLPATTTISKRVNNNEMFQTVEKNTSTI